MDFSAYFIPVVAVISALMLVLACVEVGSNDAANLVNAVFGARVMPRRGAVMLAGFFVILGASCASPVMDTVRKGIFDTTNLTAEGAVSIFLTAYLVNTVLLYSYSGFGMAVSTTATLVFSLGGAALGVAGGLGAIHWTTMGRVVAAIVVSIFLSGTAAFLAQRLFRAAIRDDAQGHGRVLLHGPWISGLLLVALSWFMLVKGAKAIPMVDSLCAGIAAEWGSVGVVIALWAGFALMTYLTLLGFGRRGSRYLFHATTILGMCCMAFAFGQNDLANCASPGLANLLIWKKGYDDATVMAIPMWTLLGCGFLMFLGMHTQRAQRITRSEVSTASRQSAVALYAPKWCCSLARCFMRRGGQVEADGAWDVAQGTRGNATGKELHYDTLRASVILAVSACVIAFASSLGLPISTTYVGFAAVVATGWGDRVFQGGRSDLKMGRAIWVVTSWFVSGFIAAAASALMAWVIYHLQYVGLLLALGLNVAVRLYFKQRADRHEETYHAEQSATIRNRAVWEGLSGGSLRSLGIPEAGAFPSSHLEAPQVD